MKENFFSIYFIMVPLISFYHNFFDHKYCNIYLHIIKMTSNHSIQQINALKMSQLCSQKISLYKSGVKLIKLIYSDLKNVR